MPKKKSESNSEAEASRLKTRQITEEMQDSYIDYAMSVIVSRALPDVRDGLKPVHRRILYTMYEGRLYHNANFRKSATVVGGCLGRYHPHGDAAVYDALVRLAQDFSLRYPLVKSQGNFGCFTKDTKVKLCSGRALSFGELIKEKEQGKRHWTFVFNAESQKIEITEIKKPRLTRKKEKLLEVTLDNGEKIKCTLDHRFMLRDGSYKEAQDLQKGDSLMPGYIKENKKEGDLNLKDYKMIYQPFQDKWNFIHRLSDKWNLKNKVYKKNAGKIRHHKDFNKLNNNPNNISRIKWKDHWKLHKETASKRHKNDSEYREKLAKGRKRYWAKKENRKKHSRLQSKRNKQMWKDPKYRKKWIKARREMWKDPEYKEFMKKQSSKNLKKLWERESFQKKMSNLKSEELKERWQDEEYRREMKERMKKLSRKIWSDAKHREHISKLMKERSKKVEWKERQSKITQALWKDSEYRKKYPDNHFKKMAKKLWENPETKKMHRAKAKKQWQSSEFREKFIKGVKKRNKKRLKENPNFMQEMANKAKKSLEEKWKSPSYKKKVMRSKILGHVKEVLKKREKITPELYEKDRVTGNGVPRFENALNYFENLSEIRSKAKTYNHKVVETRILEKKEDVYDLTTEPWHNFLLDAGVFVHNSIDGDPPAAQRYTECKLSKTGQELLKDIEKDTVDFVDNYDGTKQEPVVLPSPVPQLLLNGAVGIAVGMATNIPPHNLTEVCDACIHLIDNPKTETSDLFEFVKGPDFPTGGKIYDQKGIISAYSQGKGKIVMRGKTDIKKAKKGGARIIISEIPYQVQKSSLVEKMAKLVTDDRIKGIKNIQDLSDKEGMRIVIKVKKGYGPRRVLNRLYKFTNLQKNFYLNLLALVDGIQPRILSLADVLRYFIDHREEVVKRRTKFDLDKAKNRAHILEGLSIALDNIDEIIETIKKSDDKEKAKKNLVKKFNLTPKQAEAILQMKLQSLVKLEKENIEKELKRLKKKIKELSAILKSKKKIKGVVKKELKEVKEEYGDERKTEVNKGKIKKIKEADLVPFQEVIITLTKGGYIKRIKPGTYKIQKRGGKGIIGMKTTKNDIVEHFLFASTHDDLLFFTDSGKVFQTKVYEIPEAKRIARGRGLLNFLDLSTEENVLSIVPLEKEEKKGIKYLLMVTKNGKIKKTKLNKFKNVRRSGIRAIKLKKGDLVRGVVKTTGKDQVIITTKKGKSIRFKETEVRAMGRGASGIRGIKLNKGDEVIGMDIIEKKKKGSKKSKGKKGKKNDKSNKKSKKNKRYLLVVTRNGYGKRTEIGKYKPQSRGGKGLKTANISEKTGNIVISKVISGKNKDLIVISQKGQVIRIKTNSISTRSRATQGVRIMRLKKNDKVASGICI